MSTVQFTTFAQAPCMKSLPDVIDIIPVVPLNPPEATQMKFVGLSYESAYAGGETFVKAADEFAAKHVRGGFASLNRITDFGSGWGRITRTLLAMVPATKIHALEADSQMTALVNTTLPGVNARTISPEPPTILGAAIVNALVAFSVFPHLSGAAHEARAGYDAGEIHYAPSGGGEVRTGDYYGWAATPSEHVKRVWGVAGFKIFEWVPSGVLFPQALVFLVRRPRDGAVDETAAVRVGVASPRFASRVRHVVSRRPGREGFVVNDAARPDGSVA